MAVSLKTDLRFPESGQHGHGSRIIQLAGIAVILSDFIYFWIMRNVVTSDNMLTMLIVAVAGGVGCSLACFMNDKLSKDRTYVNVIMSDNLEAMKNAVKRLRFLATIIKQKRSG